MDWIGDTEFLESLGLDFDEVFPTMVHSTTDTAIFPSGMLHIVEFFEFGTNLLRRPSFLRQGEISCNAGAIRYKLRF